MPQWMLDSEMQKISISKNEMDDKDAITFNESVNFCRTFSVIYFDT